MQPHMTLPIEQTDPELAKIIKSEEERQQYTLELIASENNVSRAVRQVAGSVFTNKYAEGYPGKRYYGGCQYVDIAENLAIARACELFGVALGSSPPLHPARVRAIARTPAIRCLFMKLSTFRWPR